MPIIFVLPIGSDDKQLQPQITENNSPIVEKTQDNASESLHPVHGSISPPSIKTKRTSISTSDMHQGKYLYLISHLSP